LAEILVNGRGGGADHAAALAWFEKAAAHGHSGAMFALGALHGGGHDVPVARDKAIIWFRAAAERGHPVAALMLGRYLRKGLAGPADPVEARHWLERAHQLGVEEAKADLAELARLDPVDQQPVLREAALSYRAAGD
jgi:TPR repeat protein